MFKFNKLPTFKDVSFILVMESCHVAGLSILCFVVLPQMDSANGIVFTTLTALIPSLVLLISRFKVDTASKEKKVLWKSIPFDIIAIFIQITGVAFYPVIQELFINCVIKNFKIIQLNYLVKKIHSRPSL